LEKALVKAAHGVDQQVPIRLLMEAFFREAFPELKSDIEDDEGIRAALCSCRGIYEKTGLTPRAEAVSSFPS
jgi:hypothetical protein